ncbi:TVP38/TMEM64 family inner membrane protein YdjZ [Planctomycetes bacterium Poly30]|uniref:TVP38/TMEM64 family membrane protein n=1 Tax=Saltatorellus ferox TaxID=2528018 RepID=A0A518EQ00_9BACT|nr:TVP38/TMEM64 family inner membrane protein YdjZ [Planctomycetes bacterium Poly30]
MSSHEITMSASHETGPSVTEPGSTSGSTSGAAPDSSSGSRWPQRVAWVAGAAALIAGVRLLPTADWIEAVNGQVESLGAWGPLAYGAFYIVAALAFIPGSAITIGAGALFGLGLGTVVVSIASTATAALAFPLARSLFRKRVQSFASERKSFQAIDRAIADGGWKIVGLLRLSPVVPFSALNYLLGLTNVRYVPAILVSWVAMLPGTLLYVYFGAIGRDVAGGKERGPFEWALMIAGLLATLVVTVVLTRMARSRMQADTDLSADA